MRSSRRSCWICFGQPKKSLVLIYEPLPGGYGVESASEPSNKEMQLTRPVQVSASQRLSQCCADVAVGRRLTK